MRDFDARDGVTQREMRQLRGQIRARKAKSGVTQPQERPSSRISVTADRLRTGLPVVGGAPAKVDCQLRTSRQRQRQPEKWRRRGSPQATPRMLARPPLKR